MKNEQLNLEFIFYVETNEEELNTYFRNGENNWPIYTKSLIGKRYVQQFVKAYKDYFYQQNLGSEESKEMPE
jgi:hypothetical protein